VLFRSDEIATRLRLIRNHAEAVVGDMGVTNLANMIGHNFRLGEIECAIGMEQLKKLKKFVESRQRAATRLTDGLRNLPGLRLPITRENCTHVYYVYKMILDIDLLGVSRDIIHKALVAEGVQAVGTSFANIHMLPMYQNLMAYGSKSFPWSSDICRRKVDYSKGICPVAEQLQDCTYMGFQICVHEMSDMDIDLMIEAFCKVWSHLDELR